MQKMEMRPHHPTQAKALQTAEPWAQKAAARLQKPGPRSFTGAAANRLLPPATPLEQESCPSVQFTFVPGSQG